MTDFEMLELDDARKENYEAVASALCQYIDTLPLTPEQAYQLVNTVVTYAHAAESYGFANAMRMADALHCDDE